MLKSIDHLVIGVTDLETAVDTWSGRGFTVVRGGRHPTGTHNALIALADGCYLELLAFERSVPEHRWWNLLGLMDFCTTSTALEEDVAHMRTAGFEMEDPEPLSRERPDGFVLRWRLAMPAPRWRGLVPFLIEDETPRSERVPSSTHHACGVTALESVLLGDPEIHQLLPCYTAWMGPLPWRLGPHTVTPALAPARVLKASLTQSNEGTLCVS